MRGSSSLSDPRHYLACRAMADVARTLISQFAFLGQAVGAAGVKKSETSYGFLSTIWK